VIKRIIPPVVFHRQSGSMESMTRSRFAFSLCKRVPNPGGGAWGSLLTKGNFANFQQKSTCAPRYTIVS
jgi:hypothetical protein